MNAITQTDPDFTFDHAAFHDLEPGVPDHTRYNGWTAEKQKRFLTALSLGHPVTAPRARSSGQGRARRGVHSVNLVSTSAAVLALTRVSL